MKILILLIFILATISQCFGDIGLGIWNLDSYTAAIGYYDFNYYVNTTKFILPGYQHLETSNQYSTFNSGTRVLSFFAKSLYDSHIYLMGVNVDTWVATPMKIDFDPNLFTILSLESSQTTSTNDLLLVMYTNNNPYTTLITTIDSTNGVYRVIDSVPAQFASASFDQQLNLYVIIFTSNVSGQYIVNRYYLNGQIASSSAYIMSNVNSNYHATSLPYNLVYLPGLSQFYLNIDLNGTPEIFQLYPVGFFYNKAFLEQTPYKVSEAHGIGSCGSLIYQNTVGYSNSYINRFNTYQWTYSAPINVLLLNFWC